MDELGFYSTYDNICEYLLKNNSFEISLDEYHEILKNREKNNYKGHTFFDLNILTLYDEVIDVFKYNNFFIKNCNFSFLKVTRNMYQGCVHVFFYKKEQKNDVKTEMINENEKKNEKQNDTKNYNKKRNKNNKINDKKNLVVNLKVNGNAVANIKDVLKDTFDSLIFYMIDKYNIKLKINHSYRVKETTNYILINDEIYKSLYSEDYFRIDLNKLQFDIKDYSFIFYKNITNFIDYFKYIKDIHSSAYIISLLVRILADKNRIQKYSAQLFFCKKNDECNCSLYIRFIKQNQDSFQKVYFNSKSVCIKNIIDSLISLIEETKKRLMNKKNLIYPDEFLLCSFVKSFYTFKLIDLENFKTNNQIFLYKQNELKKNSEYFIPIVKNEDSEQKNINEKDICLKNNSLKCELNETKNNKYNNFKNNSNKCNNKSEDTNQINQGNEKKIEMKLSCYDILKKKHSIKNHDSSKNFENNNYKNENIKPYKSYSNSKNNEVKNNNNNENNLTNSKNSNNNVDKNNKKDNKKKINNNVRKNINEEGNINYNYKNNKNKNRNNQCNNNNDNNKTSNNNCNNKYDNNYNNISINHNKTNNNDNNNDNSNNNNDNSNNHDNNIDILNNRNQDKKYYEVKNTYKGKHSSLNNIGNSFNLNSTNETNNIININKNEFCENVKNINEKKIHDDINNDNISKIDNNLKNYINEKHINNITSTKFVYTHNSNDNHTSDLQEENSNETVLIKTQNNLEINKNADKVNSDLLININEKDNLNREDENNNNLNLKTNKHNEETFNKKDNKKGENIYEENNKNTITNELTKSVNDEILNNLKKEKESHKNSRNNRNVKVCKNSINKDIKCSQIASKDYSKENVISINNKRNRMKIFKNTKENKENENNSNIFNENTKKMNNICENNNNNNNEINCKDNINHESDKYANQINLYDCCSQYVEFPNHGNLKNCMFNRDLKKNEEIEIKQKIEKKEENENFNELKKSGVEIDEILKDSIGINEEIHKSEVNQEKEESDSIENYYFFEKQNIINRKKEIVDNSCVISNITNNCKILLNCLYEELPIKNEISSDGEKKEIDNFSVIKKISENFVYLNNHDKINVMNVLYNYESLLKRILHYEYIKKDYSFEIETCKFYLEHIIYKNENDLNEKDLMNNTSDCNKCMNENYLNEYEKNKKSCKFIENNKKKRLVDKINYYDEKIKILHKIISTYTKINLSHLDNIKSYVELTEYIKLCSCNIYHNESVSENENDSENENIYLNNFKMQIKGIKYKKKYYNDIFYSRNIKNYKLEKDKKKNVYPKVLKDSENEKKCKNVLKRKFKNYFNGINTCDNRNSKEILIDNSRIFHNNNVKYNKNQNFLNQCNFDEIHDDTTKKFKKKKIFQSDNNSESTQSALSS